MGTWTGQTTRKASIGRYDLLAYFSVHIMPDPMRGYGCELDSCQEMDNHVCMSTPLPSSFGSQEACVATDSEVINWSDGM